MYINKCLKYLYSELDRAFISAGMMDRATDDLLSLAKSIVDRVSIDKKNFKVASESQYDKVVDSIKNSLKGISPDEKMKILDMSFDDVDGWISKMMASKYMYDLDKFRKEMPKAYSIYSGEKSDSDQTKDSESKDEFDSEKNDSSNLGDEHIDENKGNDKQDENVDDNSDMSNNQNDEDKDKDIDKDIDKDEEDIDFDVFKKTIKDKPENKKKDKSVKIVKPSVDAFNTSLASADDVEHDDIFNQHKSRETLIDGYDLFPSVEKGFLNNGSSLDSGVKSILDEKDRNSDSKIV